MLDAINHCLPAVGSKKLSQFFVIRRGTLTAFNGEIVLSHPINTDLEFAPKAKAFRRAVKKCKNETIALWVNPEGNVMIHAGEGEDEVTETVECAPLDKFPAEIQTGFWFNEPRAKKAPKPKIVPPDPVWLAPDYLPRLAEARAFRPNFFSVEELVAAAMAKEPLICDVEVFPNYFLVAFASVKSGKVICFEMVQDGPVMDYERLKWIIDHFLLVDFNGNFFDIPILSLVMAGKGCADLKRATDQIIVQQVKPWQVLRSAKVQKLKVNHIDLIEVCPLDGSLKLYGGRLHVPKMQDLPFDPNQPLNADKIAIVRYYCVAFDLTNTAFCFVNLREQIELRQIMGERYSLDLRSKSDAQIAEAVINGEMQRLTYAEPQRQEVAPGTRYRYKKPDFIRYHTPLMNRILNQILSWEFYVSETGYVEIPNDPATGKPYDLKVQIADGLYTIGMGGLHSNEQVVSHKADAQTVIIDRDVASYYPAIMLNLELYPLHLGPTFLQVFRSIVQRRLEAKAAAKHAKEQAAACVANNDHEGAKKWKEIETTKKAEAETLKIVVNGTFGKTSNKWSTLYAPDLTMTITLTGQLSLLMLIERLELAGIKVCSANTDGIVSKVPKARRAEFNAIFEQWEKDTGFKTEETEYAGIYSRDVNNYLAIKTDGKTKAKGAYFNPWSSDEFRYERFKKNPSGAIIIEAVTEYLTKGVAPSKTIRSATDVRKFVSIRTVRGGAVKDGVYLGKAVRWYHAQGETGCIIYALTGKMVADTTGARPCMDLPAQVPADLDYEHYEREAFKVLQEIGASPF